MTCSSNDSPHTRSSDSLVSFEAANRLSSLHISYSRSDLESTDYVHVPTNSQLVSHMASYHKRQAFGFESVLLLLFGAFLFQDLLCQRIWSSRGEEDKVSRFFGSSLT
ncbi:unnamed protein product [Malus baccata var. baccata]